MYMNVAYSILGIILHNAAGNIVRVEQGRLRGEQLKTITGDTLYYSFKGIPYAAPPVGKLRFKAPQPAPSWGGIRNATKHGNVCPQFYQLLNQFVPGSEDCLFINVYTRSLDPRADMPVFFVIHGGGFTWGSGNDDIYGPDFLIDQSDVVVVTFNYRLDNLGFLCMGTPEVPGNAAMKDQVAALRWVQRNIKKFGGDPNNVTIFGESAGAFAVTYHTVSPMSRGLFNRAIALSGVATTSFTVEFEPERRPFVLGKILGFETANTTELLEYLQSVPAEALVNVMTPIIAYEENYISELLLLTVPVVEKDYGQEIFLPEDFELLIKKGQSNVDIFLGHTSAEGIFFMPNFNKESVYENYDKYPELLVPRDIYYYRSTPKTHLKIADYVKQFYTGSKQMSLKTVPQFVSLITDNFVYSIVKHADHLSEFSRNNNIYLYEFSFISERNVYSRNGLPYGIIGVSHFDDLMYIFNAKMYNLPLNKNATSYKMIRQMCGLITNFVKYGNPTPDSSLGVTWQPYNADSQLFLEIGEQLTLCSNPMEATMNFYDFINDKSWFKNLI
ncbi:esterase FE4-like [Bicyclus anynana]|uniref:Carboxylic ester hydrolase n=1 Tax=Bicyclus anynana TaxID=110368 RepID=A0ABM3LWP9_BICAN|nr:esterase FE4-like [Bicyclus anynana]